MVSGSPCPPVVRFLGGSLPVRAFAMEEMEAEVRGAPQREFCVGGVEERGAPQRVFCEGVWRNAGPRSAGSVRRI